MIILVEKMFIVLRRYYNRQIEFINKFYDFLCLNNIEKKNYVLNNLDELFMLSLNGKNRIGGNNSNNELNYYYYKIPQNIKQEFDDYIEIKLRKYIFLKQKYNT